MRSRHAVNSRRSMWYTYGKFGGRMHVYGGFNSENEAWSKAHEINDWDGEPDVIFLPTIDLTAAKSMIRVKLLERTGSLGVATKRIYRE